MSRLDVKLLWRAREQMRARQAAAAVALPAFTLGGPPTEVIRVGTEYAAIHSDTGTVIGHRTWPVLRDAVDEARKASEPANDTGWVDEDAGTDLDAASAVGQRGMVF